MTTTHRSWHRAIGVTAGSVVVAATLAGCAATSGGAAGGSKDATTPPSPTATSGPNTGLRGVHVAKITCSNFDLQPQGSVVVLTSSPERLVLCALPQPALESKPPTELAPPPPALLTALATGDVPVPTGSATVCPMYADAPQSVFAVLPGGAIYRLRIPQDACHHYLPAALLAMQHYRPATPTG